MGEAPINDTQQEADILVCGHGRGCAAMMSLRGKSAAKLFGDVGGETVAIVAGVDRAST
jgi:hypothetical protein